jgi:hypothetical protein
MLRRILVVLALLGVSGCCCKRPNPCEPRPCNEPPPPPGGGGDSNCAVWDTEVVAMGFTRPQALQDIQTRANSTGSGCTSQQRTQIASHITTYMTTRNCNGSITSPAMGDCAPAGQTNATCFAAAQQAAVDKDWSVCLSKLQQGH